MLSALSCLNNDDNMFVDDFDAVAQFNADRQAIEQYLSENNIDATWDSLRGLYYLIEEEGSGGNPTLESQVTVKYNGYFLTGQSFDQSPEDTTVTFNLSGLILGWQFGIPLLQKEGKGKFYFPSALGYGRNGSGPIPPNTPIAFDIELVDFE